MNGAEILYSTLRSEGVNTIYGIVGREAEVISFDAAGIDFVLTHDERSAAFMADVHGRITGTVGVCYSTFGPGATNLLTGVASAYTDRAPLLAISAQVEPEVIHSSTHQYVNQVEIIRPVTKYASEIKDISALRSELLKAIRIAQEGIPGPCFLSIPLTIFKEEYEKDVPQENTVKNIKDSRLVEHDAVVSTEAFYEGLKNHSNPLIIVGHGLYCQKEYELLSELINTLGVPFFTTYSAKGRLPASHPYCLGTISNYFNHLAPNLQKDLFPRFDLVLFIGVDMVEGVPTKLFGQKRQAAFCMINSNIETDTLFPMDQIFSLSFNDLISDARKRNLPACTGKDAIDQYRKLIRQGKEDSCAKGKSMHPVEIVHCVQEALAPTDVVISDVGLHKQYFSLFYDVEHPKTFFCSNGLGSMGFGLPAAIAAKKLYPKRNVLLACGDGGFHMSSPELETAVRHNLPIIILLFYDRSLGLIRHYHKKGFASGGGAITQYGPIDFCQMAQANGGYGVRISSIEELSGALKKAIHSGKLTLIEVPIEQNIYE